MRPMMLLAAALAIPASGVSLALTGGMAAAAGGPKGRTVCSSINGTAGYEFPGDFVTISGCVNSKGANTGGGPTGTGFPDIFAPGSNVLAPGGYVDFEWNSGFVSIFGAPTITSTSAKHCPGYVKGASSNPTAYKFTGPVNADSAGFKVPGTYRGEVCVATNENVTAAKPLKVN